MPKKILLLGKEYWFIGNDFGSEGAIAPLEHCDSMGNIVKLGESFAHWFPNEGVLRYGRKIADRKDMKELDA